MIQLMSRWGKKLDKENIWQEYPRPGFVRESYLNLNGEWECSINQSEYAGESSIGQPGNAGGSSINQTMDARESSVSQPKGAGESSVSQPKDAVKSNMSQQGTMEEYNGKILVPFSPECVLSGVGQIVAPGQFLHYRKYFRLPDGFRKERTLLHFGAVDQECKIFLNGVCLGEHKGGYLPFCFDVTDALKEDNVLTLLVTDQTEKLPHARGKQKLAKKGKFGSLFYTPQSGIWQTVWMESVPAEYIEWAKITPLYDENAVRIRIKSSLAGSGHVAAKVPHVHVSNGNAAANTQYAHVAILDKGEVIAEADAYPGHDIAIKLENFHAWSPEDPYLYDMRITLGQDTVRSYFGMRKISVGKDKHGILRFFLNNKPYFFNGLLDQGYWPESLMTPPSDEALAYDIQKLKEMGYNTIRKHVKIEMDRFYYHCDRLGMIVWQDMPNGGGDYDMVFVTYLPNLSDRFARGVNDSNYKALKRTDQEGRKQYYKDLAGMVKHLYNHPCIAAWVPFNEGWGQFDAGKATEKLRRMDSTRLINEACGWFDQKGGDMHSIHNYNRRLVTEPKPNRVVALTEYGGYAYPIKGHIACKKKFGYRFYSSIEELTANYKRLWEEEIFPNVQRGLSAAIYTQVSDIEEEINGIMTYDRDVVKLDVETVRKLNQRLYEDFRQAAD